jgi:hypothetical protein
MEAREIYCSPYYRRIAPIKKLPAVSVRVVLHLDGRGETLPVQNANRVTDIVDGEVDAALVTSALPE